MKLEKFPLVSVCIPTYQGEQFLMEALESVVNQTYPNIELVISDDASNDQTLNILEEFKKKVSFPMTIYHHTPKGIGANWNNCIKHAKGDYIKFLFQDDVLMPNCIEKMLNIFESLGQIGLVACKREFIIEDAIENIQISRWLNNYGDLQLELPIQEGYYLLNNSIFNHPKFYNIPYNKIGEPSCVMFPKNIIKKVGWFREDLNQILDYEYWYRIMAICDVIVIPEILVKFRIHPKQATQKNKKKHINDYEIYESILYKNYFDFLNADIKEKLRKKFAYRFKLVIKINKWLQIIKQRLTTFVS